MAGLQKVSPDLVNIANGWVDRMESSLTVDLVEDGVRPRSATGIG